MARFHLLWGFLNLLPLTIGFLLDGLHTGGISTDDGEMCYPYLGCFNNRPPFHSSQRAMTFLPQDLAAIGTRFFLYTRETLNATAIEILNPLDPNGAKAGHFRAARATKVLVHGFGHNGNRPWVHTMMHELLKHDDLNVVIVDWAKGAQVPYGQAAANARVVGAQIAQLLAFLATHLNNSHHHVHLIGHSLGAHVSGYAGERTAGLGRISGLDPSAPYFQHTPTQVRLDPSDAGFVDVIHTDASSGDHLGMGVTQVLGHVDFFPNGGGYQPGCDQDLLSTLTHAVWNAATVGVYAAEGALACGHLRAIALFTESINTPCPFTAYPCSSGDDFDLGHCLTCSGSGCSRLGYHADGQPGRGSLFLNTKDAPSFCNYHHQVNLTSENAVDGIVTVTVHGDRGSSMPTPLTPKNDIINSGMTVSHLVTSRTDVGEVMGLGVRYDKTTTLLIHYLYDDVWTLRAASLFTGESQTLSVFCAGGGRVSNHDTTGFNVVGHC